MKKQTFKEMWIADCIALYDELVNCAKTCYRNNTMDPMDKDIQQQVKLLVDAYRQRCLWFLRADYYPSDLQSVLRTLEHIQRYGDREAFRKAGELVQWLSPNSS